MRRGVKLRLRAPEPQIWRIPGRNPSRYPKNRQPRTVRMESKVVQSRVPAVCLFAASVVIAGVVSPAQAQGKLEARYTASLAGIPLGTGTWVIEIAPDHYTAV